MNGQKVTVDGATDRPYAFGSGTPVLISIRLVTFAGQGPGWSGTFDFRGQLKTLVYSALVD